MSKVGTGLARFNCTENDNYFIIVVEDGELDEVQVGTPLKKDGRTIIGAADLRAGLRMAGFDVVRMIDTSTEMA